MVHIKPLSDPITIPEQSAMAEKINERMLELESPLYRYLKWLFKHPEADKEKG